MTVLCEPEQFETVRVTFQRHQILALIAKEPEVCLVTGLGGGKTYTGARWIVGRALKFPHSIHLATVNSYPQAKDFVVPALTEACEQLGLDFEWRAADKQPTLFIDLGDVQAEIRVRSTEKFERLRGPEYGSWWGDEIRDARKGAVTVVMNRLRCKKVDVPRYLWTTTPRGHDRDIYGRHRKGASLVAKHVDQRTGLPIEVYRHPNGRRLLIQCDTEVNRHVMEGYGSILASNLDAKTLKQEKGGQFVATGDMVFSEFVHADYPAGNVSTLATYRAGDPVEVNLDFNVGFMAATIFQERIIDGRMRTLQIAEIVKRDSRTRFVIDEFMRRFPGVVPTIFGDANGHKRDTRSGTSDYNLWSQSIPGVRLRVPDANGEVWDGVNAVNSRLCTAEGNRDLLIHPDCELTINDLEQVAWREGRDREIDKRDDELTHLSDTVRYNVVTKYPVRRFMDHRKLAQGDKNLWRAPQ